MAHNCLQPLKEVLLEKTVNCTECSSVFHTESCLGDHIKYGHKGQDVNQQKNFTAFGRSIFLTSNITNKHTYKSHKDFHQGDEDHSSEGEESEESEDGSKPFT